MTPAVWIAAIGVGVTISIQIIVAVVVIATMRADLRNLVGWVKRIEHDRERDGERFDREVERIDREANDHRTHHPGPTIYGGDD